MRLIHISDTHKDQSCVMPDPEPGDVLCHTGDYSLLPKGATISAQIQELNSFSNWLCGLGFDHVLLCPGNHDFIFQNQPEMAIDQFGGRVLIDSSVEIDGIKFYGTPSQPPFFDWAFNHTEDIREKKYGQIPDDTDVLLTHCPPKGILDYAKYSKDNVGCHILLERVKEVEPRYHLFGHIHEEFGLFTSKGNTGKTIIFSNACIMNLRYKPTNSPNILRIN